MAAKQVNISQGTPEWHEWRRKGLGASDSAALYDLSPYKTTRDLWFEKAGLGLPDDEDRSYIFQKGHEVEAEIRLAIAEHSGIEIKPTCFENGIFFASLDGYEKSAGVLEAKLVGKAVMELAATGEVPAHHYIQLQHQMYATDSDKGAWAGRAPKSKKIQVVKVGRNDKMIRDLVEKGEQFWEMLQENRVPELSPRDVMFVTDPKDIAIFLKLKELKAAASKAEEAFKVVENQAKALATHARVRCADVTVVKISKKGNIQYSNIPAIKSMAEQELETYRGKPSSYQAIYYGRADANGDE